MIQHVAPKSSASVSQALSSLKQAELNLFLVWSECQKILLTLEGNQPVVLVMNCSVAMNSYSVYATTAAAN